MSLNVKLKDCKTGSYKDEKCFFPLLKRLVQVNENKLLDYDDVRKIEKMIDHAVIKHLKRAIKEYMSYGAELTENEKQPNTWIELTFTDYNITLDISISTDRNGNYYLLSNDNIRHVENNGDTRFSVVEIKATQDRIREICNQVFEKFNLPCEN